jgi:hypothetical protein
MYRNGEHWMKEMICLENKQVLGVYENLEQVKRDLSSTRFALLPDGEELRVVGEWEKGSTSYVYIDSNFDKITGWYGFELVWKKV